MAATYRMEPRLAASDALLSRWGPWQNAAGLLQAVPEVVEGIVLVVGDVRSGGLGALQAGAHAVRVDPGTPGGASLVLSVEACRELPLASAAALFGEDDFGRRIWFYHHLRPRLDDRTRTFWDERERWIRLGLTGAGLFEQRLDRLRSIWRLGSGRRRLAVQARAVTAAWGRGASVDRARWSVADPWVHALRTGRAPGLSAATHAAARSGGLECTPGGADVVWLGDLLDGPDAPEWKTLPPVAVGWTVRDELPEVPSGWQMTAVRVAEDCPLVRSGFVLRRGP